MDKYRIVFFSQGKTHFVHFTTCLKTAREGTQHPAFHLQVWCSDHGWQLGESCPLCKRSASRS